MAEASRSLFSKIIFSASILSALATGIEVQASPFISMQKDFASVAEARRKIQDLGLEMNEQRDRRSLFARVYSLTIAATETALKNGQFEDPKWVQQLVVRYANIYRKDILKELQGQRADLPRGWQIEFNYIEENLKDLALAPEDRIWLADLDLIYGIHVHIRRDLVEALLSSGTDFSSPAHRHDFFQITATLRQTMPQIWNVFMEYTPTRYNVPGPGQSVMINWISDLRAEAWLTAEEWSDLNPVDQSEKLIQLDEDVAKRSARYGQLLPLLPGNNLRSLLPLDTPASLTFLSSASRDLIAQKHFAYKADNPDQVLDTTLNKLRSVFKRYTPVLDSKTKMVEPLVVGGSETRPTLRMKVRKCVLFVCQTVALDATVSARQSSSGRCQRNLVVEADLTRSDSVLADNYQSLEVRICFTSQDKKGDLQLDAYAVRGEKYASGTISQQIFDMLALQIPAMTTALTESLIANGAQKSSVN